MFIVHWIAFASLFALVKTKRPTSKQQLEVWHVECELGVISDPECPVDGGWSPWGPWSPCRGPCDETGNRRRFRDCNNPFPSQNGLPCTGPDHQTEACFISNCSVEDYRKLVKSDAIRKSALHELEAVPTIIDQCLQMECPFETVVLTLAKENSWQISPESVWIKLQCVKHNLGCPVVGEWGPWSEWTQCGARCGYGLRWRLRRCDSPRPSSAHLNCAGSPLQVDECRGDQCASFNNMDSRGNWGEWGEWTACSENCGLGIKRRKRTCYETKTTRKLFNSWGTHCRGQHDQIEICENKECKLDGGWSGWGPWGPCSQTCSVGRRSRIRTCTRPEPFGSGAYCSGPKTEIGFCLLAPCVSFTHTVTVFKGDSYLKYSFEKKRSTFFHFYARFLPLSPHGVLVRRIAHIQLVRLSLQKWHLCLDAAGTSQTCTVPRLCTRVGIEPAVWHTVMITVTSEEVTMRIDEEPESIRGIFSCDPALPNLPLNIVVGERLHGEIQEIVLNFIPLCMVVNSKPEGKLYFSPNVGSDITYDKAGLEEAYLPLHYDEYLRLPCFEDQDNWRISLSLKSKTPTGTIVYLQGDVQENWLHLYMQNTRMKLKMSLADFKSESLSSLNIPMNEWLDITLSKKLDLKTIEASIYAGEDRLHVLFEDNFSYFPIENESSTVSRTKHTLRNFSYNFCSDEFFVGGVPVPVRKSFGSEDIGSLSAVIGSISVNNVLLDLYQSSVERYKGKTIQVSSRTASVSGSYYETSWGMSNSLNMTCLHARTIRSLNSAYWLYLDTSLPGPLMGKAINSSDDGRVLKLMASANNNLRGYYTCRSHALRHTKNMVTYGVLGQIDYTLTGPDMTTLFAVFTSLVLVIGTLACLVVEGFNDIRHGYGFFRDAHLSPEEEAEEVCKFIDQNMHLMASKDEADISKARARLIGRQQAEQSHRSEQVTSLIQVDSATRNEEALDEPEGLPALPEIRTYALETTHEAFKCDPVSYVSSPRAASLSSPRTKLSSSSEATSPRVLCSRLLLGKRNPTKYSYRKSIQSRALKKVRSKLFTIKSASYVNDSPAQKVLDKFRALKSEDTTSCTISM